MLECYRTVVGAYWDLTIKNVLTILLQPLWMLLCIKTVSTSIINNCWASCSQTYPSWERPQSTHLIVTLGELGSWKNKITCEFSLIFKLPPCHSNREQRLLQQLLTPAQHHTHVLLIQIRTQTQTLLTKPPASAYQIPAYLISLHNFNLGKCDCGSILHLSQGNVQIQRPSLHFYSTDILDPTSWLFTQCKTLQILAQYRRSFSFSLPGSNWSSGRRIIRFGKPQTLSNLNLRDWYDSWILKI